MLKNAKMNILDSLNRKFDSSGKRGDRMGKKIDKFSFGYRLLDVSYQLAAPAK